MGERVMESLRAGSVSLRKKRPGADFTAGDPDERVTKPTDPAISVRELNFSFAEAGRPKQVLFDIDLDIWPGEVALLTGPSGCGKTTLLTLIGGLRSVQSGQLHLLGRELHRCGAGELTEARRHIGFIFQMHNLLDFLTARQNVQMALQLHAELTRDEMQARAGRMLNLVGLGQQLASYPAQLSGGQKQRVSIARALAGHPKLVLADEPTSALDSKTGREVIDLLVHLARKEHCPILMVTHDTRIADMADRIIRMEDGRIVAG
jgi:putative ABC transport system ATP-binding protein